MNKVAAVIIAVSLFFSFTGIILSAEKEKGTRFVAGTVKTIDTREKTITLQNNDIGEFTCTLDDKSSLRGKKTMADIKVGDLAALIYEDVNGTHLAKSITVISPAGSSSEEKAKPAQSEGNK